MKVATSFITTTETIMLKPILATASALLLAACVTEAQMDRTAEAANPHLKAWETCAYRAATAMAYSDTPAGTVASAAINQCKQHELEFRRTVADGMGPGVADRSTTTKRQELWGLMVAFVSRVRSRPT